MDPATARPVTNRTPPFPGIDFPDANTLIRTVDSVSETRGMGVVLISHGQVCRFRDPHGDGSMVVFEYRDSPLANLPGPLSGHGTPRNETTSPAIEWVSLGLNCGGAILAWVGVVGTGALVPVTGGLSVLGTASLWGGALATSAQCAASSYRTLNLVRGRADINDSLDGNEYYVHLMQGLDIVGIVTSVGAISEIKATATALEKSGLSWGANSMSRQQRLVMTERLELHGRKRIAAVQINAFVKQRMLDALVASIGIAGSAVNGILKDIVIWVVSPGNA